MTRTLSRLVAAQLTMLLCPLIAHCAVTTYGTRAAWEAAVASFTTETFNTTPLQSVSTAGGTVNLSAFDIIVDANHGGIGISTTEITNGTRGFRGDVHSLSIAPPHFNRFVFDAPIRAFAADLFAVNEGGIEAHLAGDVEVLPNGTAFFGVTSDTSFTTVEIRKAGAQGEFYGMDNVSFAAIPEPAACVLMLAGLLITACRTRRR